MIERESDKRKLEALKTAAYNIGSEMSKLTSIREDIHTINRENWAEKIKKIKEDLGASQMLLFIGPFSSGKSSFINAILGENILPTNSKPCTSVVTELRFKNKGTGHSGKAIMKDGTESETFIDFTDLVKMIDGPTGAIGQCASYHHIELEYDITQLSVENVNLKSLCAAGVTIVDCPGYESPYACSEDIINEYIGRATHTFWMNPVDQFGGSFEINKIKEIRTKTTTLIPVFTKSDLKPDEEDREELRTLYSETIGNLFRHKEPIFTSATKWKEGVELAKKNPDSEDVYKLFKDSGISKFLNEMIDATDKKEVADAKVNSCRIQIEELINEIIQSTAREENFWKSKLTEMGWNENRNTLLNDIKREADVWIKNESDHIGKRLNADLKEKVVSYICETREVKNGDLQEIVLKVWEDTIEKNQKNWNSELVKIYKDKVQRLSFDNDKSFEIPDQLGVTVQSQITDFIKNTMEAVKDAGLVSAIEGIGGVALIGMTSSVASIKVVGGALAAVFPPAGGVLLGIAAISIVPAFLKARGNQKDKNRREVIQQVEIWLEKLDTSLMIESLLMNVNDEVFNKLSEESDKEASEIKANYNACLNILRSLNDIRSTISQQFSSVAN